VAIRVRGLLPEDDRSDFHSGNVDLDRFFQKYAGQNQFRHHIGTTYVAVDNERILGFATVAPSEIEVERLPASRRKRLPKYPMPVLRLARLAVDDGAQGRGVGGILLKAVFLLARTMANEYGCAGVVVDAKADAIALYERYRFIEFPTLAGQLGDRPGPDRCSSSSVLFRNLNDDSGNLPPFITNRTLRRAVMSSAGLPSTAMMSASIPGAIFPRELPRPRDSAASEVAETTARCGSCPPFSTL
jgi:GNAT superfamily N-acetyltransferase